MLLQFQDFPILTISPQMSKKSDPVSESKAKSNPITIMRHFIFRLKLLKPIRALEKRVRDQSYAADKPEHLLGQKPSRSVDYPLLGSVATSTTAGLNRNITFLKDLLQPKNIAKEQLESHFNYMIKLSTPSSLRRSQAIPSVVMKIFIGCLDRKSTRLNSSHSS